MPFVVFFAAVGVVAAPRRVASGIGLDLMAAVLALDDRPDWAAGGSPERHRRGHVT